MLVGEKNKDEVLEYDLTSLEGERLSELGRLDRDIKDS